jgi:hypothetical protein
MLPWLASQPKNPFPAAVWRSQIAAGKGFLKGCLKSPIELSKFIPPVPPSCS